MTAGVWPKYDALSKGVPPMKFSVRVPKTGTVADVQQALIELCSSSEDELGPFASLSTMLPQVKSARPLASRAAKRATQGL